MALASLKPEPFVDAPQSRGNPVLTTNVDGLAVAISPARALQNRLELGTSVGPVAAPHRWSTRRSVAFIITASFALWAALLVMASQTLHAIT